MMNANGSYSINPYHPRIYLTPQRLAALKTTVNNDDDFKSLMIEVNSYLNSPAKTQQTLNGTDPASLIAGICLAAITQETPEYLSAAKQWLELVRTIPLTQGDDIPQRNRLLALSLGYDWLYAKLSVDEKTSLADTIIKYEQFLENTYHFLSNPNYISGHTRLGNVVMFAGALALYGEDDRIIPFYDQVFANWTNGFQPALDYLGHGGGHYFGWKYGPEYSSPEVSLMWYSATGQLWGGDFLRDLPYFFIYGTDPFPIRYMPGSLPAFGDCVDSLLYGTIAQISCSAQLTGNGHAEDFYQNYLKNWGGLMKLFRIINKENLPAPVSPTSLPLAREFPGSGFMIARDTWDGYPQGDPSILVFKSTPFYTGSHQHLDQNSFILDYKGPLLIDSGVYDFWGSSHWLNYYSRTIAHNSLIIDTDTGGQKLFSKDPANLTDLLGVYKLDGITKFSQNNSCAWVRGDASKAYDNTKITSYIRDVLFAYHPSGLGHPVTFVVDRITMPTVRTPKILWHITDAPIIGNGYALIKNSTGGYGRLEFLAPSPSDVATIGGSGHQWEVNGINYVHQDQSGARSVTPGWGRIIVSTPIPVTEATFITLIEVSDSQVSLPQATPVSGLGWTGARLQDSLFINISNQNMTPQITVTGQTGLKEIYIANLKPNTNYTVSVGTNNYLFVSGSDGLGYWKL